MKSFSVVVTMLLALAAAGRATASGADEFPLEELAAGVYVHIGQVAALDDPARADSANVGFVAGERCVAVIDSGGALATGRRLAAAIAARTELPVCYVINTHVHFDHVLGNAPFVGEATQFVGHADLAEAIEANRAFFAEAFAAELGGTGGAARVVAPTVAVTEALELDLGGRTLELRAVAAAHSTTDLTVYDRSTGTLWTGDLLFRERMPVLDGSLRGWLDWMAAAMAQNYAHVVPGHGPVDHAWPAGAADQRRYLGRLLDETRVAVAKGLFLDEAKAEVAADERERWRLSERAHGLNVSRAFRELEWE